MARPKGSKNKPKAATELQGGVTTPAIQQKDAEKQLTKEEELKKLADTEAKVISAGIQTTKQILHELVKTPDERFLDQLIKDTGNEQTARAIFNVLKATSSTINTNVKSLLSMDNETMRKLMLEAYKKNSRRSCTDCKFKNFCTIFTDQLREVRSQDPTYPGRHAFAPHDIATICNLYVKDNLAPLPMSGHTTY